MKFKTFMIMSIMTPLFVMMLSACTQQNSGGNAPSLDSYKKGDQWAELSDFYIKKGMKIHAHIHVDPSAVRSKRPQKETIHGNLVSRLRFATKDKDVTYVIDSQDKKFDGNSDDILVTINHHMKANDEPYKLIYTVRQKNLFWQRIIERSVDEPYELGIVYQPDQDNRPAKKKFLGGIYTHEDRFARDLNKGLLKNEGEI